MVSDVGVVTLTVFTRQEHWSGAGSGKRIQCVNAPAREPKWAQKRLYWLNVTMPLTGRVVQQLGRRCGTAPESARQGGYESGAGVGHGPSVPRGGMAVQDATSPNEKGPPRRTARKSGRKASPSADMVDKRLTVPSSHTNHTISCASAPGAHRPSRGWRCWSAPCRCR